MRTESTPHQQPNGDPADPALLHSLTGGLVHPQSTKPQPYPYPKSPNHPKTLDPDYRPMRHWREEEAVEDDADGEEEEEMDDAEREEIRAFLKAHAAEMRRTARKRMTSLADDCEYARKHKHASLIPPPLEMLDHPDLFERAWGWDMILPRAHTAPWSQFKEYLLAYYHHNQKEANAVGGANDEGNGMASLARSCIKMETHLLFLWNKYVTIWPTDDHEIRQVSEEVTKRAHEMVSTRKAEFPAAAIALKCITEEAELICGWLIAENASPIYYIRIGNEIRQCALSLMVCKEPEYVLAMAAMMGIMKENKVVHRFLWNLTDKNGPLPTSLFIRGRTLGVLLEICDDCSAAADSSGGSTAGECVSIESDGNNFSENKLVKKDKLEVRNGISQNTKDGSNHKTDMAEEDGLRDMNDTNVQTSKKLLFTLLFFFCGSRY